MNDQAAALSIKSRCNYPGCSELETGLICEVHQQHNLIATTEHDTGIPTGVRIRYAAYRLSELPLGSM